jgi:hypothetical protein
MLFAAEHERHIREAEREWLAEQAVHGNKATTYDRGDSIRRRLRLLITALNGRIAAARRLLGPSPRRRRSLAS